MKSVPRLTAALVLSAAALAAVSCAPRSGASFELRLPPPSPYGMDEAVRALADSVREAALARGFRPAEGPGASVIVTLGESLGAEGRPASPGPVVGRAWLAPVADAPSAESDASLGDCLSGRFRLVPADWLGEGELALSVDGRFADESGYPLVWELSAVVEARGAGRRDLAAMEAALSESRSLGTRPDVVWVAAAGDMMLGRGAAGRLLSRGPESLMGGAAAVLAGADVAVVNLEGALTDRGDEAVKAYRFRFDPLAARALADAGIDAVLVSNNHALDWGRVGLLDTLGYLGDAGVGALGAGRNAAEAAAPFAAAAGPGRAPVRLYGISSYPVEGSGWDGADYAAAADAPGIMRAEDGGAERLAASFAPGALDIVVFHGGQEWSSRPDAATRRLYRRLVDLGADAVFGSHPHVIQGFELYKGKPIFWSLGNFVFPGMQGTPGGEAGLLALVGFWGERVLYARAYPLVLEGTGVDIDERGAASPGLALFLRLSRALR